MFIEKRQKHTHTKAVLETREGRPNAHRFHGHIFSPLTASGQTPGILCSMIHKPLDLTDSKTS